MAVRIFMEGDPRLQAAVTAFLRRALEDKLDGWRIACGKGISETINECIKALKDNSEGRTNDLIILLLDSDHYLDPAAERLIYLNNHPSLPSDSNKERLTKLFSYHLDAGQVYFMVQEMEAWFLADAETINDYFQLQYGVEVGQIVDVAGVEQVSKPSEVLHAATGNKYKKVSNASDILHRLNPEEVSKLPHFALLLARLRQILAEQNS